MMVAVSIIEKQIHPARQCAGRIGHPNRPPESRARLGFEPQPGRRCVVVLVVTPNTQPRDESVVWRAGNRPTVREAMWNAE